MLRARRSGRGAAAGVEAGAAAAAAVRSRARAELRSPRCCCCCQDRRAPPLPTSCRLPSAAPGRLLLHLSPAESPPAGSGWPGSGRTSSPAGSSPRCKEAPQPLLRISAQPDRLCPSKKPQGWKMWQPATERLQHFQTMLKSKLNVLTLKKEPLPAVIFHEPEAIELCTTTPLMKTRTHSGCKKRSLQLHQELTYYHYGPWICTNWPQPGLCSQHKEKFQRSEFLSNLKKDETDAFLPGHFYR